jgi:N-acetylglutamate synthase-like GNAT family acetyltransferase
MAQSIIYKVGITPSTDAIIDVYESSGIRRPIDDDDRIRQMYQQSNLIISAWDGSKLIGVARSLTDFCYCCYLSDLAVHADYQKQGIGKTLIEHTQKEIGNQTMLLLLSAPNAMSYYPHIGFKEVKNGFIIPRKT